MSAAGATTMLGFQAGVIVGCAIVSRNLSLLAVGVAVGVLAIAFSA